MSKACQTLGQAKGLSAFEPYNIGCSLLGACFTNAHAAFPFHFLSETGFLGLMRNARLTLGQAKGQSALQPWHIGTPFQIPAVCSCTCFFLVFVLNHFSAAGALLCIDASLCAHLLL